MDYKKAYFILFNAITTAIYEQEKIDDILKKAHHQTDIMYKQYHDKLLTFPEQNHDD